MGMKNLKGIRQGKHFEIDVDEIDQVSAEKKLMKFVKNYW